MKSILKSSFIMLLLLGCLFLPIEQANAIILDYVTNPGDDESVYLEYHWDIEDGERYYYSYPNAPKLQAGTKRDGNDYERNYLAFLKQIIQIYHQMQL